MTVVFLTVALGFSIPDSMKQLGLQITLKGMFCAYSDSMPHKIIESVAMYLLHLREKIGFVKYEFITHFNS